MNTCRLCGEESQFIKLDIEIENGNNYLIECNNCHSIFTKYQTPPTKVSKIYNDLFTNGEYERHRKEFYKLISGKSSYFPFRKFLFNRVRKKLSGDIIVEIGGGVGAFGQYVTKKGYKYQDFDISKNAIQYVKALGLSGVVFDPENRTVRALRGILGCSFSFHELHCPTLVCLYSCPTRCRRYWRSRSPSHTRQGGE